MDHIPGRPLLVVAAYSRVMITKAVKDLIPERRKHRNEK
jgi:hypothetical protein